MPPLPARSVVDAREVEMKSKKHLGLTSSTVIGDELDKDCRQLEKYVCLEEIDTPLVDFTSHDSTVSLRFTTQ